MPAEPEIVETSASADLHNSRISARDAEQLKKLSGSTVIAGIGNQLKGDDAAGPVLCSLLRLCRIKAEIIDAGTTPENFIFPIVKIAPKNLLIIDAVDFGAEPGSIKVFDPEQLTCGSFSTHSLSPALFIDLISRSVNTRIYFIGIQPEHFRLGQRISAPVSDAVRRLCRLLVDIFSTTGAA